MGDKDLDHPNVKDSRVQGEKREALQQPVRQSKRVKERKGRGDKRTFDDMRLDKALYGESSEDEEKPGKFRAVRTMTLLPGSTQRMELSMEPMIPSGQIAVLQTCPGLADQRIVVETRCVDPGQSETASVWISNLSSQSFRFKKGQRVAESRLLPVVGA